MSHIGTITNIAPILIRGWGLFVMPDTYPDPMPDDIRRDANGYDYEGYPASRLAREQKIANESWPLRDKTGRRHAEGIDDQPADNQRPCWVRLVFDVDGEVELPGRAVRWNRSHVYISVSDPRVPNMAVWVRAGDCRRRDVVERG